MAAVPPVPPVPPVQKATLPTAPASRPSARFARRDVLLVVVVGLLIGLHRELMRLSDTDVLWGARSGMSGHIPRVDPYSWTAFGHDWLPNSWGWNVILGAAYRAAGVWGFHVLGLLIAVGLALTVARRASQIGATPVWTAMALITVGQVALIVSPRAQAAAALLILPYLMLTPSVLYGARPLRAAGVLVGLQVLWINVHTSAVLGPLLLAAAGAALILQRRVRRWGRLGALVAATAVASFVTPYGAAPVLHVDDVRRASAGLMEEWDRPGFGTPAQLLGLAMLVLAVAVAWFALRAGRWDSAAVLLVLAAGTAYGIRFAPLVAVAAVPELAVAGPKIAVRPAFLNRTLAAGCVVVAVLTLAEVPSFRLLSTSLASPRLVKELPRGCRVVNDMTVGGSIILLRPDARVSMDSRNDMYGRDGVIAGINLLADAPGTSARMDAAGVNCVLARDGYRLVQRLMNDPAWRVVDRDGVRTLLVRYST